MNLKLALQNARVQYQQGADANEIRICCLFCEERGESRDIRYRLGINILTSRAQCFNCHWASRHAVEAISAKLKFQGITVAGEKVVEDVTYRLPEDFELIDTESKDSWMRKATTYLLQRRITKRQIREKEIGLSLMGHFSHRIIFPVKVKGELKGIVARSLVGQEPRYLNAAGPRSLYNYPEKAHRTIVVTEGIVKALNLESILRKKCSSVSILGHTLTEAQEEVLFSQNFEELVLWPDPDKVGTKGFITLADRLSTKVFVSFPIPIPTRQVDEIPITVIQSLFWNRKPYSETLALAMMMNAVSRHQK